MKLVESKHSEISIKRQCELLCLNRSTYYYRFRKDDSYNIELTNLIDEEYTKHPFYGVRRMQVSLEEKGHKVNHKRIRRISRMMGIEAIYPKPKLTKSFSEHRKYPYLLRGLKIDRPDQVWCSDITYIKTKYGFVYLTVIMDWFSRYVLSFEVSTSLDKDFCIKSLKRALLKSKPEIFNSDQGVQFTNDEFISCLKEKDVRISMDGRGRAHDNIFIERLWRSVKYEEVYLNEYETVKDAVSGIGKYFNFYNNQRPHQALIYKTPCEVYRNCPYETNFINHQDGFHDKYFHLINASILS
jgi:putative transposase